MKQLKPSCFFWKIPSCIIICKWYNLNVSEKYITYVLWWNIQNIPELKEFIIKIIMSSFQTKFIISLNPPSLSWTNHTNTFKLSSIILFSSLIDSTLQHFQYFHERTYQIMDNVMYTLLMNHWSANTSNFNINNISMFLNISNKYFHLILKKKQNR